MISSTSNTQVKQVIALQTKAKARRESKQFVVEGLRLVSEVPADRLENLYVTESFLAEHPKFSEGRYPEIVTEAVMKAMSDTQTPQGILGVVRQQEYSIREMCKGEKAPLLLILENLQDPGNLGTIMRTAEAAGVNGVIMSRDTVEIYNPKVVRSTMGAIVRLPFTYVDDLFGVMEQCKCMGITTYAAHLQGKNTHDLEDYRKASAFLVGNEGNGLTDELSERADVWIRIPMAGQAESLNAAVAAAVLSYEAARQRGWRF